MNPFKTFFLKQSVVGYKPEGITLKSGKTSYWYANCRVLNQSLAIQKKTASFVVRALRKNNLHKGIDAVLGVPEGATALGAIVNAQLIEKKCIKDALYVFRKKPKEHGDPVNRFWVTGQQPKKVVVLEDATTTGGSALAFIEMLQAAGVSVVAVIALINREQTEDGKTVGQLMKARGIKYFPLLQARDVLPVVISKLPKGERVKVSKILNDEYAAEYAPDKAPFIL